MSNKRKFNLDNDINSRSSRRRTGNAGGKKHSLDSDEEDDVKDKGRLDADEIEGEEESVPWQEKGSRMTAFNMKEEMEEGYFDKQGHFIWKNEKEIRDNWLDNVDWGNIKTQTNSQNKSMENDGMSVGSDISDTEQFDELKNYREILKLMKPGETVKKALNRLGGSKALSSVERLKRKKAGTLVENEDVTKLTELANDNLTALGNMDIYQETYESISKKVEKKDMSVVQQDMFGDSFDTDQKLEASTSSNNDDGIKEVMWDFKWKQDSDEIHGPHTSLQMFQWVNEGYFKDGVFVRKHGDDTSLFYSSNRTDFGLYI